MTLSTVAMATVGRRRRRHRPTPVVVAAIAFLVIIIMSAALARFLSPHDPETTNLMNVLAPPSPEHPFGTDSTGRDTLSRLLHGAQLSLLAPLAVSVMTMLLGILVGLMAARLGGAVDLIVSRAMDIVFAFPTLLLALLAVGIFGPGLLAPICALAIGYIPFMGRIVRSAALQEQVRPYVGAHAVMGFSSLWITLRHILPNIMPILLAQGTLSFGYAMLDIAALSYLGLGVQPPAGDWGSMIAAGQSAVLQGSMWVVIFPGLAVVLTVLAVNLLGESLSDRLAAPAGGIR
jgi:peptide/nickel transport system permease protein